MTVNKWDLYTKIVRNEPHYEKISTIVFPTQIVQSLYILNFKPLTICGCTARFVSDLVGNPEDRFCCNVAQIGKSDNPCMINTDRQKKPVSSEFASFSQLHVIKVRHLD